MESLTDPTAATLLAVLPEWELALRVEGKTPGSIVAYVGGTRRYLDWCTSADAVPMRLTSLQAWMAHLLESGNVLARKQSVKRFSAWLPPVTLAPKVKRGPSVRVYSAEWARGNPRLSVMRG